MSLFASSDKSEGNSLGVQLRKQLFSYIIGTVLLAILHSLMWFRDNLFRVGVNAAVAGDESVTVRTVGLILGVVMFAAVVRVMSRMTVFHAGRNAEYRIRADLLRHLHRLGYSFFQRMPTGEIMSRATNDLGQVRLLLGFGVLNVVNTLFGLVSALSVMVQISPVLTLAALTPLPLFIVVTRVHGRTHYLRTTANQEALGRLSERVQGSLAGIRVVRAYSLENRECEAFDQSSKEYLNVALALARNRGILVPMMGTIGAIGMLVVFWYGGHLVLERAITEGDFIAFWAALARLTWPIVAFGFVLTTLQRGRVGYERIRQILDAELEVVDGPSRTVDSVLGDLRVVNLRFDYGGQSVLDGVSFHVPAGKSLAVVGKVGSGKSTLSALTCRLLPTPTGSVFLDGHDICQLPLRTVRRAIGYAQQDAFLFSTTVARNIAYALADPDSEESQGKVRVAAAEAQVLTELDVLPDGLDSVVGERGLQLSGGQKQRVALARALLYEPSILLLDDPLSAVDARTERAILEAIDRQARDRTVVLVTSRVAAAARCDRVVVVDKGRVAEEGTHEELVRLGGIYAGFAEEQRLQGEIESLGSDSSVPEEPADLGQKEVRR
ncbi:MAG: ABC transporter ATP-binding protein/permease [Polyangiaceae bacterium]|nr:ABC transporter ATP-binding protein/permease [Polyangiaceae bacterium]